MKKTNRKNKTGLKVNWPTGFYTMEPSTDADHAGVPSLLSDNPDFIKITLRVRLTNAIEDKSVAVIGTLKGGKGRPKLVFANTPVSKETLEAAAKVKSLTLTFAGQSTFVNGVDVKSTENIEVDDHTKVPSEPKVAELVVEKVVAA